jgi:hypothetical protein
MTSPIAVDHFKMLSLCNMGPVMQCRVAVIDCEAHQRRVTQHYWHEIELKHRHQQWPLRLPRIISKCFHYATWGLWCSIELLWSTVRHIDDVWLRIVFRCALTETLDIKSVLKTKLKKGEKQEAFGYASRLLWHLYRRVCKTLLQLQIVIAKNLRWSWPLYIIIINID